MKVQKSLCALLLSATLILEICLAWIAAFGAGGILSSAEWAVFASLGLVLGAPLVAWILLIAHVPTEAMQPLYIWLALVIGSNASNLLFTVARVDTGPLAFVFLAAAVQAFCLLALFAVHRARNLTMR